MSAFRDRWMDRLMRLGIGIAVPLTLAAGVWLLFTTREPHAPPQPTDGSAHVVAFPAQPGPPVVTLAPAGMPDVTPAAASKR
jgi:hypothetical protein